MDGLRALLTILFGALAGGITNRVAIWMLFHPYRPPRLLGRRLGWLQGAMPKNQGRLARSIGQAVGTQLLTPEDLADALREEGLREAFERRLEALLRELLETEHPSLTELLPEAAVEEAERLLASLLSAARDGAVESLDSSAFVREAGRTVEALADSLDRADPAEALSAERLRTLRGRVEGWLERAAGSEAFEDAVRRRLEKIAGEILRPDRALEELLPAAVVATFESVVANYLPLAMERLGRLLEDPGARERFEQAVSELLDRFMRDLRFHQRVVARLIITEDTVDRVVRTLEEEGAEQMGELLREPDLQDAMARSVNEAVVDLLRRPATEVLGRPEGERVRSALDSLARWVVRTARDPETRASVLDQLEEAVWRAGEWKWSELVRRLPAERLGPWLAEFLRSDVGRELGDDLERRLVDRILTTPIGEPSRFLHREAPSRLADLLGPAIWEWIAREIPAAASRVEIAGRVEEKVREYPIPELEALIRSITERELQLIVRLGYVLGGGIGALLVAVNALLG